MTISVVHDTRFDAKQARLRKAFDARSCAWVHAVVAGERALPPDVERFVLECIPSVVHLEALLLLRARAEEELPLETIATLLYVDPARAAQTLTDLALRHLIVARSPRGPFRFMPRPDRRPSIDALAETYRTMLVPLTRFIHESAEHRSIRDFADAFRFRKE